MNRATLLGDIVHHWRELARNHQGKPRQTVIFAVNVEHSRAIVQQFQAAGICCEHLDGQTPDHERDGILARLASGETRVVSNCQAPA
jgi:superfamily II DNA or RNA helicase